MRGISQHGGLTDGCNIYQLTDGVEWLLALSKLNSDSECQR